MEPVDITPPVIISQSLTIMENVSNGTEVGTVLATDNNAVTSYAITSGNTSNAFAISNNGVLTTANTIDYETISNYSLTIQVSDEAGNTASSTVTVNITNISLSPKAITLNASRVQAVDAILRGDLTELGEDSDGSIEVSEYGFIYSTNTSNQTSLILGAGGVEKTNLGSTNITGQFSNRITGLEEDTTYHYRAYAGNDIGTNFGEVRSFTTEILHATFTLSGAADGEQSGMMYPRGSHTYNIPMSNTHAYNLTVDADSNVLDNLAIYEGTNTNELYIREGPFSMTTYGNFGLSLVTTTFGGADNGRRYLVLPLATTNHQLVISNSNMGTEGYTLILREETGTTNRPIGRLLIDETPMGFFSNNDPEFYWFHVPPNGPILQSRARGIDTSDCAINRTNNASGARIYFSQGSTFSAYETLGSTNTSGYHLIRVYNGGDWDYTQCQFSFRTQ